MKALILLIVLTLAGCVTDAPREPVIVTKTVEVPVQVKCQITYPTVPSPRLILLGDKATGYDRAAAALQELEDQRWYGKELEAALRKCAKDESPR